MNPYRRRRVEELCHSAAQREPSERSAFLAEACGDDAELRREVERLLDQPEAALPLKPSGRLAAGARLGPYRIETVLGVGGMGEVDRAVDTRLDRNVAIKISREQYGLSLLPGYRNPRNAMLLAG